MSAVKLPLDLTQIHPFRELKSLLGGSGAAHAVWWELWRTLGYWAQEGSTIGKLPTEAAATFKNDLAETGASGEDVFQHLLTVKLLVPEDGGWFCPRFAVLNSDLLRAVKREQIGGNMRKFLHEQGKVRGKTMQLGLAISENKFVDETGAPLAEDEAEKVTRLIISCDNALFKGERPPALFTEALIQDALRVVRKLTEDEIDCVLRRVAYCRNHPILNCMTAEKLLPQFRDIMGKLS